MTRDPSSEPPDSLTGAPDTPLPSEPASISIDWLSLTFHVDENQTVREKVQWVLDELALFIDDQNPRDYGMHGYSHCIVLNGGPALLLYSPECPVTGVHLVFPPSSFASFLGPDDTFRAFVWKLRHDMCGQPCRVDIAYDDYAGCLDFGRMRRYIRNRAYTTLWHSVSETRKFRTKDGEPTGDKFEFGSRKSDSYCRIYDKLLEQQDRGIACEHEHWVRVEMEFKRAKAAAVLDYAIAGDSLKLAGLLRSYLDFKVMAGMETNKSRWATVDWWHAFLHHASKAHFNIPKPARTIETVEIWLERQVEASLALVALALGDGELEDGRKYIWNLVEHGVTRLTKQQREIVAKFRRQRQTADVNT